MNRPRASRRLVVGLLLWASLTPPAVRDALESSLAGHMVAQIGLLAASGWWLGRGLPRPRRAGPGDCNAHGASGLVLALFTLAFWLLPVNLDAALQAPSWEAIKFISVPLLLGMPLGRSWPRLPGVLRAVLWAQLIAMLVVMGWIYRAAPVRLCNNYMLDQQALLAWVLWGLAAGISAYWVMRAFIGESGAERGATPSG